MRVQQTTFAPNAQRFLPFKAQKGQYCKIEGKDYFVSQDGVLKEKKPSRTPIAAIFAFMASLFTPSPLDMKASEALSQPIVNEASVQIEKPKIPAGVEISFSNDGDGENLQEAAPLTAAENPPPPQVAPVDENQGEIFDEMVKNNQLIMDFAPKLGAVSSEPKVEHASKRKNPRFKSPEVAELKEYFETQLENNPLYEQYKTWDMKKIDARLLDLLKTNERDSEEAKLLTAKQMVLVCQLAENLSRKMNKNVYTYIQDCLDKEQVNLPPEFVLFILYMENRNLASKNTMQVFKPAREHLKNQGKEVDVNSYEGSILAGVSYLKHCLDKAKEDTKVKKAPYPEFLGHVAKKYNMGPNSGRKLNAYGRGVANLINAFEQAGLHKNV